MNKRMLLHTYTFLCIYVYEENLQVSYNNYMACIVIYITLLHKHT